MLHWPDSMVSYVQEDKVLFSQDAFGQHIASSAHFDDEFIAWRRLQSWRTQSSIITPTYSCLSARLSRRR